MRIAVFYRDFLSPGGVPSEMQRLVDSLSNFVEEIRVYCYHPRPTDDRRGNVRVRSFLPPRFPGVWNALSMPAELRRTLGGERPTPDAALLVGSFIPANLPVSTYWHRRGTPYLYSVGAGFNPYLWTGRKGVKKGLYAPWAERSIVRRAASVHAYSWAQIDHLERRGYSVRERCFVEIEGIDPDTRSLAAAAAAAAGDAWDAPEPRFGFLGRLDTFGKGLDVLLDGWATYVGGGGVGTLDLVGPGSDADRERLRRIAWRLGAERVRILPALGSPEKCAFLARLSLFLHPSRHEGVPRVLREALASGTPVLVTDNTNVHDIVEEYGAGYVVGVDGGSLAQALFAYRDLGGEGRRALRSGARSAARAMDWDAIGRSFARHFESVVVQRRRPDVLSEAPVRSAP